MKAWEWKSIWVAPKDGTEIVVCVPGATDHWYIVFWSEDPDDFPEDFPGSSELDEGVFTKFTGGWAPVGGHGCGITEESLEHCHLLPMFTLLETAPSSICRESILNTHPNSYR